MDRRFVIREMMPGDIDEVVSLIKRFFPYIEVRPENVLDRIAIGYAHFLVACSRGKVIGFVDMDISDIARILGIAVDQPWRRRGVATKLMQRALRFIKSEGFSDVQLLVRADNKAAIRMYEKLGFRRGGFYEKPIQGQPALIMTRAL